MPGMLPPDPDIPAGGANAAAMTMLEHMKPKPSAALSGVQPEVSAHSRRTSAGNPPVEEQAGTASAAAPPRSTKDKASLIRRA